jgi:hypothetical protein
MKKILTLTLAIIFALMLTFTCFAEEETPSVSTATVTSDFSPTEATTVVDEANTLPIVTTATEEEIIPAVTTSTVADTEEEKEESFANYCLGWLLDHTSEILSSLSLIGTALICVLAKSTLLPVLTGGLNKITSLVAEFEEMARGLLDKNNTNVADISKDAEKLCKAVAEAEAKVERIAESVQNLTNSELDAAKDRELVKMVMTMQAELFHTLVANSSLPQWRKDDIEKKYKDTLALIQKDSDNV